MSRGSIIDQLSRLKFVVASSYRSGTQFTSNVLNALGVKAGHEDVFRPDRVLLRELRSRNYEADVSGAAYHWLDEIDAAKVLIVHLIRHPVDSINSMYGYNKGDTPIDEIIQQWYRVHSKIIEAEPHLTILLEDFDDRLYDVLSFCMEDRGITLADIKEVTKGAYRGVSSATKTITWNDLPNEVKDLAEEYYPNGVRP